MADGLHYDLFVVGATDPSPVAQMHLAARLAEKFHAPAAQIAQAIASRNLRAGQGLDDAQARVLADQLTKLGAVTELRPSVGGKGPRHTTGAHPIATGAAPGGPPTLGGPMSPHTTPGGGPAPTAGFGLGTLDGGPTMGGPPVFGSHGGGGMPGGAPTLGGAPGLAGRGGPVTMGNDIVGRDPFAGSASPSGPLPTLATPLGGPGMGTMGGGPMPTLGGAPTMGGGPMTLGGGPPTMGGPLTMGRGGAPTSLTPLGQKTKASAFSQVSDTGVAPKLELARGGPATSSDEMPAARRPDIGASLAGGRGGLAPSGASGVEAVTDAKAYMVRCMEHGLYFDKRTASGCRKCLEPAAAKAQNLAKKMDRRSLGFKLMMLREDPVRRAFYGLAFALLIGLIPAAVHAIQFGRPEVDAYRTKQAELSKQIGTQETLDKWRELDDRAHDSHGKNMRNTAIIWVVIGGVCLGGWYRWT